MKLRWVERKVTNRVWDDYTVTTTVKVLQYRKETHRVSDKGIIGVPWVEYGEWEDVPVETIEANNESE